MHKNDDTSVQSELNDDVDATFGDDGLPEDNN